MTLLCIKTKVLCTTVEIKLFAKRSNLQLALRRIRYRGPSQFCCYYNWIYDS